ncbi:MAG TPA: peptidoglycan-binding domain-containing protein, partial [Polyangiaceae bacterium]|nr:peptidoglycan-binding domain-containing protein [Polyangiaceae bacterium]
MRTLRLNSTGDDVKVWQTFLKEKGLFTADVDGKFGPQTLLATKAFQHAEQLVEDGFVGNRTLGTAMKVGLDLVPDDIALPNSELSLSDAWAPPPKPEPGEDFVVKDPRVITNHEAGVLPCPPNPPPPVGWAYWSGAVPAALSELAAEVERTPERFPMGSFVLAERGGQSVAARV